ncbi:MAG: T9SS type A sorting domain-containing protein [Balneolaceae bacterium]
MLNLATKIKKLEGMRLDSTPFPKVIARFSFLLIAAFFFTLLINTNLLAQEDGESVEQVDRDALMAIYAATNGDDWLDNSGWGTDDPVSSWVGISGVANVGTEAEPEWRVVNIEMPRNNMTIPGHIPPEIEDLEYLENFEWDVNLLEGQLPAELANLEYLQFILVRTNLLSGTVDWDAFAQMPNMEQFRIRDNYFSGDLPEMLGGSGEWPVLQRFYVDANRFTGQIPEVHTDLTSLVRVYFHNNRLTGPIPDWSHLEEMEYYRIANNDLDPGPIPEWIFDSWGETLIRFQIHNTNRTGSLSPAIAQMEALEQFIIGGPGDTIGDGESTADIPNMSFAPSLRRISFYGGGWSGPIPDWIGDVAALEDVHFQDMDITGTIPNNLADSDAIVSIHLEDLNIEGGLPDAWSTAQSLQEISIIDNENMEIGAIPSWLGQLSNLEILRLADAGLTGEIPTNFINIGSQVLNLRDNPDLTGEVPGAFSTRTSFTELELSRTGLTFPDNVIPSWIANNRNLSYLGLGGLGLEGQIPDYFGNDNVMRVNLNVLALDDNNLSGEIPASLGNTLQLDSLNLANNNLSGEIPAELANAGRATEDLVLLSALQLSGNTELSGEIPLAITDATFMRVIEYSNTNLCEPEDPSYQAWLDGIPDFAAESYPTAYYSIQNDNICGTVSIEDGEMARKFQLKQNYPNPFNPTTKISYEIPEAADVKLNIYNMLGQRVATLIDGHKAAGVHQVNFDASSLASGSYMYRLEAADKVLTQQMMLIK